MHEPMTHQELLNGFMFQRITLRSTFVDDLTERRKQVREDFLWARKYALIHGLVIPDFLAYWNDLSEEKEVINGKVEDNS